ncbi:MAG: hypothetical protein J5950_03025 [Clostridia bacterium]|nr:hypothetical protein [Clostridia bacterium]
MTDRDKQIVRDLAKRYMELTTSEKQNKMFRRMKDNNDLIPGRPPVLIDEVPWYQMNIDDELTCICEDQRARGIEYSLRVPLFYMKHFSRIDNIYEPFFRVSRAVHMTGIGVDNPQYEIRRTDDYNNIVSRELEDVLEDESCLEKFKLPEMRLDPELDQANVDFATELLGDSMPVKLRGFGPYYFCAWDRIAMLRGMEAILIDLYDRPEYLLAIYQKFIDYTNAHLDFLEKYLEPDTEATVVHCTPALVSGLGEGLKGTWFRDNAQPLGDISPAMFEEFAIDPIIDLASRFRYTYFGCCEPLDNKMDAVMKIPNLRKIGSTPWANVEKMAERIGGDFVLARKPSPAHVALKTDPDVIRKEIEDTVKVCIKYGCPYEFVIKDISTVSNDPYNLIVWADTVASVLDEYYGA